MASEDTLAGRLHAILTDMRRSNGGTVGSAWSRVLGIETSDPAGLLQGIAMVIEMPDAIESAVRQMPGANHELLLRWQTKTRKALSNAHQLEGAVGQVIGEYDETTLLSLEHAADALSHAHSLLHMEPERITTAGQKVTGLLDALERLEAPVDVREMLVRHALRLQAALRLYRISGPEAVKDALVDATAGLGAAVTVNSRIDDLPGIKEYGNVIRYVADSLHVVPTVARFYPQIEQVKQQVIEN